MALSLICTCGARFALDEAQAGGIVPCPECQQAVKVPVPQQVSPRTSACALASAILATVGAFTVVGTLAAVGFGVAGLVSVSRNRGRIAGAGLACFGIVAGLFFTAITLVAVRNNDLFGLAAWWREQTLAGRLDRSGPAEVVDAAAGFAITRPTPRWGITTYGTDDPVVAGLQEGSNLILLDPSLYAYVDVRADFRNNLLSLDECAVAELARHDPPPSEHLTPIPLHTIHALEPKGGVERCELVIKVRGAMRWVFLVRLHRIPHGGLYIVRGYAPKTRFAAAEGELRAALDSFRLLNNP